MPGNIWILAEHFRGELTEAAFESLALARELASALSVEVEAVLLGHNQRALAAQLGGANRVLYADHPALAEAVPGVYADAMAQLAAVRKPALVLVPLTNVTLGAGTLLAARLEAPAINFCVDLRVEGGQLQARCLMYGGKMETIVGAHGSPLVAGLWPGIRNPELGHTDAPPAAVEDCAVDLPASPPVRFKRYIEAETGDVDIREQPVLVAVGRGIQSQENIALAEELAAVLGGVVCGSRPVIDQGWLPLSRQVGKSGASVKPKLYIAAGVSGAPEHVEGMRNAELIVAINSDPQAPIFQAAHYGIVGDVVDVLPALTEAARARKGAVHA